MRIVTVLAAAMLFASPAYAQNEDGQIWTSTSVDIALGGDFTLGTEFVARFSDDADGVSELQFAGDLEWESPGGATLSGGYSYVPRYNQGVQLTREHRTRQSVSVGLGNVLGGEIEGRARLEQRWRNDGDDVMLRLRGRLTWTRPVGPSGLAVRLQHESFAHLNATDWGGDARFDRVRNSLMLRRKFGDNVTGEIGYLNQWGFVSGGPDQVIHAANLGLSFSF